jgi:uncharacterized integral membrane protein (TIGR00698 family)
MDESAASAIFGTARKLTNARRFALLPGVALSAAIAACATQMGHIPWFAEHGLTALTIAIVMGVVIGNTLYARVAAVSAPGVTFSKQTLLRAGVVLYGLRLTLGDVARVGAVGVVIDALVVTSTFALAIWLGTRVLGLDRVTAMLIGAGSAICGAAAVMATEPVVKGRAEQAAVAVACVVLFGTLAIFLYPALYHLGTHWQVLNIGEQAFGVYAGSTIHEVAQVFAASRAVSEQTAGTAVITKMVRVMMLAPFLVGLSAWLSLRSAKAARPTIAIPWFAIGFIAVAALNSLAWLPQGLVSDVTAIDTYLLAMAMAALGLTTHVGQLRRAGVRPLTLALLLFGWLIIGGAAINRMVWLLLR